MLLETLVVGPLDVNCYILADSASKKGIIIDPGGDFNKIDAVLEDKNIDLLYIVITHGHWDHIYAVNPIKSKYKCPVCMNGKDIDLYLNSPDLASMFGFEVEPPLPINIFISERDVLYAGEISLKVLDTPGHSEGSISLNTGNLLFTGDLIFQNGVGRTDFHGGDEYQLKKSIQDKIFSFPDETIICPGHGPSTTVGNERSRFIFHF